MPPPTAPRSAARTIAVVAGFEARRMARAAHGWLSLLCFGLFAVWLADALAELARKLPELSAELDLDKAQAALAMLELWTDLPMARLQALLTENPPTLAVWLAVMVVSVPGLAATLACDQTSTDIRTRHLRFLLTRASRAELYWGKALAAFGLYAACVLFAAGATTIALLGAPGAFGGPGGAAWLTRGVALLLVLGIPMVALMALSSALIAHPLLAMAFGFGLWFAVWLGGWLGGMVYEPLESIHYLLPTAFKYRLLSPEPSDLALAVGHQLALAAGLFGLGLWRFRGRDV